MSAWGIYALSHMWDFPGCCTLYHYPAAFSGSREDSSDFAPGSVSGPHVAQTAVAQLSCGAVCCARSTSPARAQLCCWPWCGARCSFPACSIPSPAGDFHSPIVLLFKLHARTLFGTGLKDRDSLRALPASRLSRTAFNMFSFINLF